ncbi:MAG: hypothetical protein OXN94_17900, partial [Chloroflexota bacterium]|nr:hypothetical protein [Chloroflexota bacterium]
RFNLFHHRGTERTEKTNRGIYFAGVSAKRPYKACPVLGHADALFLPHPPAPSPKHQGRGAKLGGFRNNLLIFARIAIFFVLIRYCPGFH